jgi:hypothetical protein
MSSMAFYKFYERRPFYRYLLSESNSIEQLTTSGEATGQPKACLKRTLDWVGFLAVETKHGGFIELDAPRLG